MEKYRARVHFLQFYPDNEEHQKAFEKLCEHYEYCAILHDRDEFTEEDEKRNPDHKAGTLKKPHIHAVIRCHNAAWNTAICDLIGHDTKWCEKAKNIDAALQYLLHYNDPAKAQYNLDEAFGDLFPRLAESITKVERTEGEKVMELLDFIGRYEGHLTITEFARYCAENGYWSEFRRSGAIFVKIIDEANGRN